MRKFDWSAWNAAIRTAGALMVGNTFVGYLILDKTNWVSLGALLALGIGAIIAASWQRS
jgi:hypothetical protein